MTPELYHGHLVIDKPSGITSRAAVDKVQRWFPRGTRIGHTGTLDPLATGVLVLCIGAATRLAEYVQDMSKCYRAGLRLGARSDTDDAEGTVTAVAVGNIPHASEMTTALQSYVGEIDQVPPDFSAAKVAGRRAYDLSRRGHTVALAARKVKIYGIDVVAYEYPRLDIEVRCGRGTYIRSLARDLGDKLGCGALIESLRRTRVGPFKVEDAVALDAEAEVARGRLLPVAAAVAELPKVAVDERAVLDLTHGRAIVCNNLSEVDGGDKSAVAAITCDGRLIAVGTWDSGMRRFAPKKMLLGR